MSSLEMCLDQLSAMHNHLCPKQVLGVRTGMFAAKILGITLPQKDKRLFAFVETDGCYCDGVAVSSGCWVGHRTMQMMDYGKVAVTFVDTADGRAVRIRPAPQSRTRASIYAPDASDRWHAQLAAYHVMPDADLFQVQEVRLTVSLEAIISTHGLRVVCARCGEDIINEREVAGDGIALCRACAGDSYCLPASEAYVSVAMRSQARDSVALAA